LSPTFCLILSHGWALITSYFRWINDSTVSDDKDLDWDPHAHCDNVTPPYIADEEANLDDPDDHELDEKDIHFNNSLKSFAVIIEADEWLLNGKKHKHKLNPSFTPSYSFFICKYLRYTFWLPCRPYR
jgi:hypothetical protein